MHESRDGINVGECEEGLVAVAVVTAVNVGGAGHESHDAAAVGVVECVGIVVGRTRGRQDVGDIRGASSSVAEVKGVRYTWKRRALRLVCAFRVGRKNGSV